MRLELTRSGLDMPRTRALTELGVDRTVSRQPHGRPRAMGVRNEVRIVITSTEDHRQVGRRECRKVSKHHDARRDAPFRGSDINSRVETIRCTIVDDRAAPGFEVSADVLVVSDDEDFDDGRAGAKCSHCVQCHRPRESRESETGLPRCPSADGHER